MEKILKIEEHEVPEYKGCSWQTLVGYKITTDRQEIIVGIENDQACCENWGYFMSEDKFEKFIGSELIDVRLTDELNKGIDLKSKVDKHLIDENDESKMDLYCGGAMFVDFVTRNGVLQFVAYNEHNGYYGHSAAVISTQVKHEEVL